MRFSCIIPAYNEGPRIANVIQVALACDLIDEVIVVNDGSTDDTQKVIDRFEDPRLQKIQQKNTGKTGAVFTGIDQSTGDAIVMIDSDLIGLSPEHIRMLILPVKTGAADVTLSIRENSLLIYKWMGTDFVSGERVIPRDIFDDREDYLSGPGFGLEVIMNAKIIQKGYRVKNILFPGVITPRKSVKMGLVRGTLADWSMTLDLISTASFLGLWRQFWYFSHASASDEDQDDHQIPSSIGVSP